VEATVVNNAGYPPPYGPYASPSPVPNELLTGPEPTRLFGGPDVPRGWTAVYSDRRGNYALVTESGRKPKGSWREYYLVRTSPFPLVADTEAVTTAATARFRVRAEGTWRIADPAGYLREGSEYFSDVIAAAAAHCDQWLRTKLSDITRAVRPEAAMTAHDLIRQYYAVDLDVGYGLVIRLGHAVVQAPEAFYEALNEVEGAEVRIAADDVGSFRETRKRVDDLDFENARKNPDRATQRTRAADYYKRADRSNRFSNGVGGSSRGYQYPALDKGLLDEEPAEIEPPDA
jgi:hypothetical protein